MASTEKKMILKLKVLETDLLQPANFHFKCVKNPSELPGDEDDDQYTDYFLLPIENLNITCSHFLNSDSMLISSL